MKELENIDVELNKKYPNKLFKEAFKEKIHGHNFLYINVPKQLYLVNFTEPLISKEELASFKKSKGETINDVEED